MDQSRGSRIKGIRRAAKWVLVAIPLVGLMILDEATHFSYDFWHLPGILMIIPLFVGLTYSFFLFKSVCLLGAGLWETLTSANVQWADKLEAFSPFSRSRLQNRDSDH